MVNIGFCMTPCADAVNVPPVVDGLVDLFKKQAVDGSQPAATWQAHLLSKTLCAHPEASYQLLHRIELLISELGDNGHETEPALWTHLRPFLSFCLLDHGHQGTKALSFYLHFSRKPGILFTWDYLSQEMVNFLHWHCNWLRCLLFVLPDFNSALQSKHFLTFQERGSTVL